MFDIAIIGSGAGGSPAAWLLTKLGYEVVLIEQGDIFEENLIPIEKGGEFFKYSNLSSDPEKRGLEKLYTPVDCTSSPIKIQNYYGMGGSTLLYSCMYPRLHESDFHLKSSEGISDDWPLSLSDILPYYQKDVEITGVAGLGGNPLYPDYYPNLPPVPLGPLGKRLAIGMNELGWSWWPAYASLNTKAYDGRDKDDFERPSNLGPSGNSKGSTNNTYLKKAIEQGITVFTGTKVINLKKSNARVIEGIECIDKNKNTFTIKAKVYILSAGGIFSPHLLLNSKTRTDKEGLGNSSGLVGRNLMMHPWGYCEGVTSQELLSNFGPQGCSITSQHFYFTRSNNDFKRGYTLQFIRGPFAAESAISNFRQRNVKPGETLVDEFLRIYNKTLHIAIICDDFPEYNNRIVLDQNIRDSSGKCGAKIHYKLSTNSKLQLSEGIRNSKKLLKTCGATNIKGFGPLANTGWHILGTCKMGLDHKTSVVNKYGKCHNIRNLFISDGSIFTTGGSVNPCATIQALSLYIATNIHESWSEYA